jgi:hypothetical protein
VPPLVTISSCLSPGRVSHCWWRWHLHHPKISITQVLPRPRHLQTNQDIKPN